MNSHTPGVPLHVVTFHDVPLHVLFNVVCVTASWGKSAHVIVILMTRNTTIHAWISHNKGTTRSWQSDRNNECNATRILKILIVHRSVQQLPLIIPDWVNRNLHLTIPTATLPPLPFPLALARCHLLQYHDTLTRRQRDVDSCICWW